MMIFMDGDFRFDAALEARTDFLRCGVTTILLPAGRNPAAFSFVALFAQAQIWRRKSKKASNPAQLFLERLLPDTLNALPVGNPSQSGNKAIKPLILFGMLRKTSR
jgi:hypothetical protein